MLEAPARRGPSAAAPNCPAAVWTARGSRALRGCGPAGLGGAARSKNARVWSEGSPDFSVFRARVVISKCKSDLFFMRLGRQLADRDPACCQQPQLLVYGQNPSTAARLFQRVVEIPRFGQHQSPRDQTSGLRYLSQHWSCSASHLVDLPPADPYRGWCGCRELETPYYPISRQSQMAHHRARAACLHAACQ